MGPAEGRTPITLLGAMAAFVLLVEMPVPLYWFVVHPQAAVWRRLAPQGFLTGALVAAVTAWTVGGVLLVEFYGTLLSTARAPALAIVAGFLLIGFDGWIFWRAHRDLGRSRLVGWAEITGRGELAHAGIYARLRHPRYLGMIAAVAGAGLLAGTKQFWIVAGIWCALAILAILLEEREMRGRFGPAYEAYCRRVPRFVPHRLGS